MLLFENSMGGQLMSIWIIQYIDCRHRQSDNNNIIHLHHNTAMHTARHVASRFWLLLNMNYVDGTQWWHGGVWPYVARAFGACTLTRIAKCDRAIEWFRRETIYEIVGYGHVRYWQWSICSILYCKYLTTLCVKFTRPWAHAHAAPNITPIPIGSHLRFHPLSRKQGQRRHRNIRPGKSNKADLPSVISHHS